MPQTKVLKISEQNTQKQSILRCGPVPHDWALQEAGFGTAGWNNCSSSAVCIRTKTERSIEHTVVYKHMVQDEWII